MPLFSEILQNKFEHKPTSSQKGLFKSLDKFIDTKDKKSTFILKGYAGTGKTSVLAALTKTLPLFNYQFVLLAPTGRAAKVISQYSKRTAYTIHRKIFKTKGSKDLSGPVFTKAKNYHSKTIFIVDEASMISTISEVGEDLLGSLIDFVFENDTNKLLLVGDVAQLPPVFQETSYALEPSYLESNYNLNTAVSILTDITRQALDSGILINATNIRNALSTENPSLSITTKNHQDIYRMTSQRLEDGLRYAHDKYGIENSIVICRSNKNAVMYNHFIRNQLLYKEDELDAGDILLIARNNYIYASDQVPSGFLANGDFIEILKIKKTEEIYDLRFADIQVKLLDYPEGQPIEIKIILDTLHEHSPALSQEKYRKLYNYVIEDYKDLTKTKQKEAIRSDKYLNAIQVKYAYALTCHKSQGGQWDSVFVDQGYIPDQKIDHEFLRWVYTAITRAKNELFLVNFDKQFF
ncbi:ATP-dependent DNA helicase [Reichenbachiella versicolor]|uniref:ATP-dependent DNA helicase n=1 Tax=Reichenbachiella versicolor TaxID=1821036 RepID=UPI000D6E1F52|nr:AAA family ATPase [Reichenbachiella versicolor]